MDIFILGSAGFFARNIFKDLVAHLPGGTTVTLGDYEYRPVRKIAKRLGDRYSARMIDLLDQNAFEKGVAGSDIIVSLAGPWYATGEATISGALSSGKPLVITSTGVRGIPEIFGKAFLEKGISCISGTALFPGGLEIILSEMARVIGEKSASCASLQVNTGKYGGLAFIREYFYLLSNQGPLAPAVIDKPCRWELTPKGVFQKISAKKRENPSLVRTEILSVLQETLRKKPRYGDFQGISLSLTFHDGDNEKRVFIDGESIKGFLFALIRCAITAALECPPGSHYLPDIYEQYDHDNLIGKQVEKISSEFRIQNSE